MMSLQALLALSLTLAPALALNIPRQGSTNGTTAGAPTIDSTETYTGDITYYNPAGGYGACGETLADTDAVAAVNTAFYDTYSVAGNPNNNALCGKQIEVTYTDASGASSSATVTIKDRCGACAPTDVDLTPVIFDQLVPGGEGVGRTTASWKFV